MRFLIPLGMILALALPAHATHCESYTTSAPEFTIATYYVDLDCVQGPCMESIWIYEESNEIPGLQRGDEVVDDTCHDMIPADTIVF